MFDDEDLKNIAKDYNVSSEVAEDIRDIAEATGIDEDDAAMLYDEGIGPEEF